MANVRTASESRDVDDHSIIRRCGAIHEPLYIGKAPEQPLQWRVIGRTGLLPNEQAAAGQSKKAAPRRAVTAFARSEFDCVSARRRMAQHSQAPAEALGPISGR